MNKGEVAKSLKYVKYWLTSLLVLVLCMIAVGGVTRLTRSGLSMVEWKPVSGIIPPLTEQDWNEQFELYKKTPEFQQVNSSFNVQDYKNIFLWEYLHRVLGRLIFLIALFPGVLFWKKKIFSGRSLTLILSLIAAQGLIGWLMVKSGLNHEPHVSPFMLALHFFSALSVLSLIFYYLCMFFPKLEVIELSTRVKKIFYIFGGVFSLQVFYGCLTSGWKAGFSFNTYPLMGGQFFPPGGMLQEPGWLNFLTNPSMVQWTHRWLGIVVFLISFVLSLLSFKRSELSVFQKPVLNIFILILVQVILGILNILYVVPISLAVVHQVIASLIALAFLNIIFRAQVNS